MEGQARCPDAFVNIHIAMPTITRHSTSDTNLREEHLFASCDACQIAFVDVDRTEKSDGYDADRDEPFDGTGKGRAH